MKATSGPSRPSAGLTGVSACNRVLAEVYFGKGQKQQMEASLDYLTGSYRMSQRCSHLQEDSLPGQEPPPAVMQVGVLFAQLNIGFAFSAPPRPPLAPSGYSHTSLQLSALILSMPPIPPEISLTDSLQQLVRQCPGWHLIQPLGVCSCSSMCAASRSGRFYLPEKFNKQTSTQEKLL